ncbi:DUF3089 domain-containing protein [Thermaurantiacus sp.]
MWARRFLWIVAMLALLVVAVAILWRLFGLALVSKAVTPAIAFAESPATPPPDYGELASWAAHPKLRSSPSNFVPQGFAPAPKPPAAAFFVPPTAFFGRNRWNAPLDDTETNARLDTFIAAQASVFNGVAEVWAPRYRQATFGAFLTDRSDAERALDLAYGDIARAFAAFLAAQPADRPLILAGHSQGTRHLLRLLAARKDDTALGRRLVAVYAAGWPVARGADLAALGLAACSAREEAGCLLSWQSFAADGDVPSALERLAAVRRIDGRPLGPEPMVCTNPLTGGEGQQAPAEANPGALRNGVLAPRLAGARCEPRGLLLLEPAPADFGPLVLPGGDFHAYDYPLFWAALRADVEARLSAYARRMLARQP